MDSSVCQPSIYLRETKNLTNQQRHMIADLLLLRCENGKLKKGTLKEVGEMFSVASTTIAKIWKRAITCIANGLTVDVSSNMATRVGRKRLQIDLDEVSRLPFSRRTNVRSLSKALNMSKSTIHRRIKEGLIRRHTNALKPYLSEEGKRTRLQFCLSMLEPHDLNNDPIFKDMYNFVHIDEKWFFLTKESESYYLIPNEIEPERTCKSKRFITKVMFLTAVARPRYDANGNLEFSGKIGMFPFIYKDPAKRTSKNRVAGTMETKAITSVTKDIIRACLIENVLPAIRAKWPRGNEMETIFIQQDNARPHIKETDIEFIEAAWVDGFDIRLLFQPPNSSDMNVLDLGYFRAIQSLQHQEAPATIDELVQAVEKSFEELSSESLNNVYLSLQSCMIETIKCFGGNKYKLPHLPHMGKKKLAKTRNLPVQLKCDLDVVQSALAHLQNEIN